MAELVLCCRISAANNKPVSAYALIDVHIHDIGRYMEFMQLLRPLVSEAGGRYLVRGGEFQVLQGDYVPRCLVLLEFPSMDALDALYHGDSYRKLVQTFADCAQARVVAVEGLPG